MMPDEVRKMDNKKCLIFIRGFNPILDNKYIPFKHPVFSQTADGEGEVFQYGRGLSGNITEPPFEILDEKSLAYYEKLKGQGRKFILIPYHMQIL